VDLIFLARQRGYRMAVMPVVWADRRGSRMHARPRLALRVGWDLLPHQVHPPRREADPRGRAGEMNGPR